MLFLKNTYGRSGCFLLDFVVADALVIDGVVAVLVLVADVNLVVVLVADGVEISFNDVQYFVLLVYVKVD